MFEFEFLEGKATARPSLPLTYTASSLLPPHISSHNFLTPLLALPKYTMFDVVDAADPVLSCMTRESESSIHLYDQTISGYEADGEASSINFIPDSISNNTDHVPHKAHHVPSEEVCNISSNEQVHNLCMFLFTTWSRGWVILRITMTWCLLLSHLMTLQARPPVAQQELETKDPSSLQICADAALKWSLNRRNELILTFDLVGQSWHVVPFCSTHG